MNHIPGLMIAIAFCAVLAGSDTIDWRTDLFGQKTRGYSLWSLTLPTAAGEPGTSPAAPLGFTSAGYLATLPASAAMLYYNDFSASHSSWLLGMHREYMGVAIPTNAAGVFGIHSSIFATPPSRQAYTLRDSLQNISLVEYTAGGTWAGSLLNEKISIGGTVSYAGRVLEKKAAGSAIFGIDAIYAPTSRLDVRGYARNISAGALKAPLQYGAAVRAIPMKTTDPAAGPRSVLTLSAGIQKTTDNAPLTGVSAMFDPWHFLSLRAGFDQPDRSDSGAPRLSLGIGLKAGDFSLETGWRKQSEQLGTVWTITAAFCIDGLFNHSARTYYRLGTANYAKRRYAASLAMARKGVGKDPNHWLAHEVFRKSLDALEHGSAAEFSLLYYGNFKNNFSSSSTGSSLGGLSRTAATLQNLRRMNPEKSISIVTGNMLTVESTPEQTVMLREYFSSVSDDVRCAGQGEIDYGLDRLFGDSESMAQIAMNTPDFRSNRIIPHTLVTRGKTTVAVFNAIRNPAIDSYLRKRASSFPQEIKDALRVGGIDANALRVVVIQDVWDSLTRYAPDLKDAQVIVYAGQDAVFPHIRKIEGFAGIVVSVPRDGAYIGKLTLWLQENNTILSVANNWIPIAGDLTHTPQPLALYAGGAFGILTYRDGFDGVTIRAGDSLMTIPLPSGVSATGMPSVSAAAGRVAYRYRVGTDRNCTPLAVYNPVEQTTKTIIDTANVGGTWFSPDGRWIYCLTAPCGDTTTDISRTGLDGGMVFPVVAWKNSTEKWVDFSPVSKEMLFGSNLDGSWQIYLTDQSGSHPLRLTDSACNHLQPSFSLDGRCIAYLSDRGHTDGDIDLWVYDREKAHHRRITENAQISSYCWLETSRRLLFSAGLDFPVLFVVDLKTGNITRFFPALPEPPEVEWGEINPRLVQYKEFPKVMYQREFEEGELRWYWAMPDGSNDQLVVDRE